jgi:hypothetical protein
VRYCQSTGRTYRQDEDYYHDGMHPAHARNSCIGSFLGKSNETQFFHGRPHLSRCLPRSRPETSTSPVLLASTVFWILNGGRGAFAEVWRQSPNEELLKHTLEGNFTEPDQRVLHHQAGAITIALGIVEI